MKTTRRHELQTNQLAEWMGSTIEQIQPYSKSIIAVVLIVCAAGLVYLVISGQQTARQARIWQDFFSAERDADELKKVAETHPGTPAALWAEQTSADIQLSEGINALYSDREAALTSLEEAQKQYQNVADNSRRFPMLLRRAQLGLAQTYEAMSIADGPNSQDHLEKAKDLYEGLVADNAIGRLASGRLETLVRLSSDEFYVWLAQQKPLDFGSGLPDSGFPGEPTLPPFRPLPERPRLDLPFADPLPDGTLPPLVDPGTAPGSDPADTSSTPDESTPDDNTDPNPDDADPTNTEPPAPNPTETGSDDDDSSATDDSGSADDTGSSGVDGSEGRASSEATSGNDETSGEEGSPNADDNASGDDNPSANAADGL